jgi:hypothetical protein
VLFRSATVLLFTTGRGTPLGFPVPTVKIASNSALAARKPRWIDFDAGRVLGRFDRRAAALCKSSIEEGARARWRQYREIWAYVEESACRRTAILRHFGDRAAPARRRPQAGAGSVASRVHSTTPPGAGSPEATPRVKGYPPRCTGAGQAPASRSATSRAAAPGGGGAGRQPARQPALSTPGRLVLGGEPLATIPPRARTAPRQSDPASSMATPPRTAKAAGTSPPRTTTASKDK